MHLQALLVKNVLLSTALNVTLSMLLNVTNVLIIIISLMEIVIHAMKAAKNVMKLEIALYVHMATTFLVMKMVQWIVKAVFQGVEIANTGQVNVQNVYQDFISLQIRHAAHASKDVGNAIHLQSASNVMQPKQWCPLHALTLSKTVRP